MSENSDAQTAISAAEEARAYLKALEEEVSLPIAESSGEIARRDLVSGGGFCSISIPEKYKWDRESGAALPATLEAAEKDTLGEFDASQATGGIPSLFYPEKVLRAFLDACHRPPRILELLSMDAQQRASACATVAGAAREGALRLRVAATLSAITGNMDLLKCTAHDVGIRFPRAAVPKKAGKKRNRAPSDSDDDEEVSDGEEEDGGRGKVSRLPQRASALGRVAAARTAVSCELSTRRALDAADSASTPKGITLHSIVREERGSAKGVGYGGTLGGFLRLLQNRGSAGNFESVCVGNRATWLPPPSPHASYTSFPTLPPTGPSSAALLLPTPFGIFVSKALRLSLAALRCLPTSSIPLKVFSMYRAEETGGDGHCARRTSLWMDYIGPLLDAIDAVADGESELRGRAFVSLERAEEAAKAVLARGKMDASLSCATLQECATVSYSIKLPVAPLVVWEFSALTRRWGDNNASNRNDEEWRGAGRDSASVHPHSTLRKAALLLSSSTSLSGCSGGDPSSSFSSSSNSNRNKNGSSSSSSSKSNKKVPALEAATKAAVAAAQALTAAQVNLVCIAAALKSKVASVAFDGYSANTGDIRDCVVGSDGGELVVFPTPSPAGAAAVGENGSPCILHAASAKVLLALTAARHERDAAAVAKRAADEALRREQKRATSEALNTPKLNKKNYTTPGGYSAVHVHVGPPVSSPRCRVETLISLASGGEGEVVKGSIDSVRSILPGFQVRRPIHGVVSKVKGEAVVADATGPITVTFTPEAKYAAGTLPVVMKSTTNLSRGGTAQSCLQIPQKKSVAVATAPVSVSSNSCVKTTSDLELIDALTGDVTLQYPYKISSCPTKELAYLMGTEARPLEEFSSQDNASLDKWGGVKKAKTIAAKTAVAGGGDEERDVDETTFGEKEHEHAGAVSSSVSFPEEEEGGFSSCKKPRILSALIKKAGGVLGAALSSLSSVDELDFNSGT